jgi:hypothetical protein
MAPKIAIIFVCFRYQLTPSIYDAIVYFSHADFYIYQYSMYGHVKTLAEAEKKGVEAAGGTADLYQ